MFLGPNFGDTPGDQKAASLKLFFLPSGRPQNLATVYFFNPISLRWSWNQIPTSPQASLLLCIFRHSASLGSFHDRDTKFNHLHSPCSHINTGNNSFQIFPDIHDYLSLPMNSEHTLLYATPPRIHSWNPSKSLNLYFIFLYPHWWDWGLVGHEAIEVFQQVSWLLWS